MLHLIRIVSYSYASGNTFLSEKEICPLFVQSLPRLNQDGIYEDLSGSGFWPALLVALLLFHSCARADAQTQSAPRLVAALREIYSDDDGEVRYFLRWFDLNGDGKPEAIVHVVGPNVCGTGGCDTHIFARRGGDYKLVSTIGLSRPPVIASQSRAHGWRSLLVFIAGGGVLPGHYVELRFDGRTYPRNPTVGPAKRVRGKPRGTLLIRDYQVYTEGSLLIPPPPPR